MGSYRENKSSKRGSKTRPAARGFEEELLASADSSAVLKSIICLFLAITGSGCLIKSAFLQGQKITSEVYLTH